MASIVLMLISAAEREKPETVQKRSKLQDYCFSTSAAEFLPSTRSDTVEE